MQKEKLSLSQLKIESFVTEDKKSIKAGNISLTFVGTTSLITVTIEIPEG